MRISDLLTLTSVTTRLKAANKKQALQDLAKRAASVIGVGERVLFETLMERERLGSTGIGNGVAVPHGRLPGLSAPRGFFARLEKAVDFEAVDNRPVDLIFLLVTPEGASGDHLKALALVSRLLRDRKICEKLRGTDRADALYALLVDHAASDAA
ncbi:MAG: PTS sugar transporter subunit IIA [Alphaproteobacteria bacterium]|nr:PTS sugar transporter subunit IIA [Alphaproteobacteria bacterium]